MVVCVPSIVLVAPVVSSRKQPTNVIPEWDSMDGEVGTGTGEGVFVGVRHTDICKEQDNDDATDTFPEAIDLSIFNLCMHIFVLQN